MGICFFDAADNFTERKKVKRIRKKHKEITRAPSTTANIFFDNSFDASIKIENNCQGGTQTTNYSEVKETLPIRNDSVIGELKPVLTNKKSPAYLSHFVSEKWHNVHFIFAIEAGGIFHLNEIAQMEKEWNSMTAGLKNFLSKIDEDNLASMFTFNSDVYNDVTYKPPSELKEDINQGLDSQFDDPVSYTMAIENIQRVLEAKKMPEKCKEWLHYIVLLTIGEANYPNKALSNFLGFIPRSKIRYLFTAISGKKHRSDISKIVSTLEGDYYTCNSFEYALDELVTLDPNHIYND